MVSDAIPCILVLLYPAVNCSGAQGHTLSGHWPGLLWLGIP
jgi:hypothetical protein